MATERSSLVEGERSSERTAGQPSTIDNGIAPGPGPAGLRVRAQRLIEQHTACSGRSDGASLSESPKYLGPMDELAVCLLALNLLLNPPALTKVAGSGQGPTDLTDSVRSIIGDHYIRQERCEALSERIQGLLDSQMEHRVIDEAQGGGEGEGVALLKNDEEELEIAFWRSRALDGLDNTHQSIPDLLVPDLQAMRSPWISHPFIRIIVERAWSHGMPTRPSDSKFKRKLQSACTPRRLNVLHLASFLVVYALTISICVGPGTRITPYKLYEKDPKPAITTKEVWWIVLALTGWFGQAYSNFIPHPVYLLRVLPLGVIIALTPFGISDSVKYNLLCASVPFLTLSLIFPLSASFPLLLHRPRSSIMPLSALLVHLLSTSMRIIGIMFPLLFVLFALFAWTMNGDLGRAGLVATGESTGNISTTKADPVPTEPGMAPFQARLSIFLTLCLVLFCALRLSMARTSASPGSYAGYGETKRWRGALGPDDDWEREYGLRVGRTARAYLLHATRILLPPIIPDIDAAPSAGQPRDEEIAAAPDRPAEASQVLPKSVEFPIVVPLNALSLVVDCLIGIVTLLGKLRPFREGANRGARALLGVTEWLYLLTAGLPCLLLKYAFGWLP